MKHIESTISIELLIAMIVLRNHEQCNDADKCTLLEKIKSSLHRSPTLSGETDSLGQTPAKVAHEFTDTEVLQLLESIAVEQ